MKVLLTGCAGFIGYHLSKRLLKDGHEIFGLDNLNAYYDINLKEARLKNLQNFHSFSFEKIDLINASGISKIAEKFSPDFVVHLAAQAGVRYSKKDPQSYIDSNITGFLNVLEACRNNGIKDLFYASSSSVYGGNSKIPFSESDPVKNPTNIYAVTKRSNEMMAHSYQNLYGINSLGFRFFTVYGPWGRPDMAYFFFAERIKAGNEITVFNKGEMSRDFTYIDDIVEGIISIIDVQFGQERYCDFINLGNNQPEKLMNFINELELALGKKALIKFEPAQAEEMIHTWADISKAQSLYNFEPTTSLRQGLQKFAEWHSDYLKKQIT